MSHDYPEEKYDGGEETANFSMKDAKKKFELHKKVLAVGSCIAGVSRNTLITIAVSNFQERKLKTAQDEKDKNKVLEKKLHDAEKIRLKLEKEKEEFEAERARMRSQQQEAEAQQEQQKEQPEEQPEEQPKLEPKVQPNEQPKASDEMQQIPVCRPLLITATACAVYEGCSMFPPNSQARRRIRKRRKRLTWIL